jgi:acetyl esterase/lipase
VVGGTVLSVIGAIVLLLGGMAGMLATWNAARPLIDPTRWYSPSWLPAMVVTELAPFWLAVHAAVLGAGLLLGGWGTWGGRVGGALLAMAMLLLCWLIVRSRIAVRRLRAFVAGTVHPALGRARLIGRPVPAPPGIDEVFGIEWRPGLALDVVRQASAPGVAPVLVYVHGGGWTGGDPQRQARDLYHALALDGWVVLAVRYPFTPHVTVEHQIEIIRAAVRWARHGLGELGHSASRVVSAGGSAGAHLAAMAALTARHGDEQVDACVGMYGVYDMANRNHKRAHWHKIRDEVMLATVAEAPDRYRAVSPIDHVHAGTPPFLIVHGTHDTLVPIGEGEQFADVLRAAGRPVDLVPVYGAQHAFDAVSSITSRTVAAAIRDWLRSQDGDR